MPDSSHIASLNTARTIQTKKSNVTFSAAMSQDPLFTVVQPRKVERMNDEELGLPRPEKYEGEQFTVEDYKTEEYAEARTLEEAIAIRGVKAFLRDVTPDDFLDDAPLGVEKIGIADLWSDSTWKEGETERDVDLERSAASLKEGDLLEVRPCSKDISEWGYRYHLADGSTVPYTPYHDYDDQLSQGALENLRSGEWLACRVRELSCFGEDGIDDDPGICWRVYSCKVTVYRGGSPKA